jgi:hypothetical protein
MIILTKHSSCNNFALLWTSVSVTGEVDIFGILCFNKIFLIYSPYHIKHIKYNGYKTTFILNLEGSHFNIGRGFFIVFFSSSWQIPGLYLKMSHYHFLQYPPQFIKHNYLHIRPCIICAIVKASCMNQETKNLHIMALGVHVTWKDCSLLYFFYEITGVLR